MSLKTSKHSIGLVTRLMAAAVCTLCALPALAQLRIVVDGGVPNPIPVAVVPFGFDGQGPAPLDMAEVIDADLTRSGRFAPLSRRRMLERPTDGSQVDYADWAIFKAEIVVVGKVTPTSDGQMRVTFQVMDVPRREQLLGFTLASPVSDLRTTAHYISDVIYESLIGEPGIFSTRIAYVSADPNDQDRFSLVVADADGANQREVINAAAPIMSPAWSPDGREMAYVVFEDGGSAIYVQTLATGQRRQVSARKGVNGAPAFSPDGQKLALTLSDVNGNLDIFVADLRSNSLTRITKHPAIDTEATWSADGDSIYFNSDRSGGPQVYQVSSGGGPAVRLTFEGNYNARPRVSPDGDRLAVVHIDNGKYRIATVQPRSGNVFVLSKGQLDESPSFAPNGSTLIYATREGDRGVLATVSTDGLVRQRLDSRGRDVREPVWGPLRSSRLTAKSREAAPPPAPSSLP